MTVYPEFIAPLFDKYVPLPESELKQKIEKLAASVNFPLKKLLVVHGKIPAKIPKIFPILFSFFFFFLNSEKRCSMYSIERR